MRRVGRRMDRARTDMAEAARHTDSVWPDELRVGIIFVVAVIALRIPARLRGLVKFGVGKEPQTKDPSRLSEIGADGQRGSVLEGLAALADLDARIIRCVLERVGRAAGAAMVKPEAEMCWVWRRWLLEARLVDCAQPFPARVTVTTLAVAISLAWVRGDDLEQVEGGEAVLRDLVPEAIIASGPDDPHVPPLDLLGVQGGAIVHVVEIVFRSLGKTRRRAANELRLVWLGGRRCRGRDGEAERATQKARKQMPHHRLPTDATSRPARRQAVGGARR